MLVEEVMSREPFTVDGTESIASVAARLLEANVRHLPVLEGGRLIGIVSDRDMRALFHDGIRAALEGAQRRGFEGPISSIMNADVISVTPAADVTEVIDLMLDHGIGAVPVIELDGSRLLGIVSYLDVLRVARDVLVD